MKAITKVSMLLVTIFLFNCSTRDTVTKQELPITELSLERINSDTILVDDSLAKSQILNTPFSPSTRMEFILTDRDSVNITLFDVKGSPVTKPLAALLDSGKYFVRPNLLGIGSGVYFIRLSIGNKVQTKKILLLK